MSFTHLHLHTQYSLLDGAINIKELVQKVKELGMDSVAVTDHGVMYGVVNFYKECKKNNIKPIIGCEVYVAPRSMYDKDQILDKTRYHLVLLAENNEGYKNLMKIVSASHVDGLYYKPRTDKEFLRTHSKGIIALSACLAGEVQRYLQSGEYDKAKNTALEYEDIFGKGNFFLEVENHGMAEQLEILPDIVKISEETGIETVATNDAHYLNKEDAHIHDIMLCIQTGKKLDDEVRMRFPNDEFYLKSQAEMEEVFFNIPAAISNTEIISKRCNVELDFNTLHLPKYEAPAGLSAGEYLRQLCLAGLEMRYKDEAHLHLERLDYELKTIENMGYIEYFLIVWDFINYAKEHNIMVGPGRGSAAGSIVAYVLRITNIDPIKYGLIFERFLNPERVSMPDIDIDFCYERRGEVIDYVIEKYGHDNVAQIVTFGTFKPKAAIRDICRVMDISIPETNRLAKEIPNQLNITVDKALALNKDLKERYENEPQVHTVLDAARAIEGAPRHTSTHAAGVVITEEKIEEYAPLCRLDTGIATQFDKDLIEELGLLKMDFLGLRNLTVIRDALDLIKENHGVDIDFENNGLDDPEVYKMIAKGNTQGVFQLESAGMTSFMKNLKPDCLEDIIAGISLYRPGPMASIPTYIDNKKNPQKIQYLHPTLEPILKNTYGCLVYQEQVMEIVRKLAGYSYGRSDILRRAMGKKKMDVMLAEKEGFLAGCIEKGISEEIGETIYNQMISFAEYAFNKSHAAAYAVIGYETAYLKRYYPVEYFAALMTSVMGDENKLKLYIQNAKEMGIKVNPPMINKGEVKFSVKDGEIHYSLLAIKNLGKNAVTEIVETRKKIGEFKDINHLITSLPMENAKKKAVECLIRAGALREFEGNMAQHLAVYEDLINNIQKNSKNIVEGQLSFFDAEETKEVFKEAEEKITLPRIADFSERDKMQFEKEMLGVYLSGHPLDEYIDTINNFSDIKTIDLIMNVSEDEDNLMVDDSNINDGENIRLIGIVADKRTITTKKGDMMAFIQLEDLYGTVEVVVFPRIFEEANKYIDIDSVVALSGKVQINSEETGKIIAEKIVSVDNISALKNSMEVSKIIKKEQAKKKKDPLENYHGEVLKLRCLGISLNSYALNEIIELIKMYPGDMPVILYLEGKKTIKAKRELWISPDDDFQENLKEILGPENVKISSI